MERPRYEGEDRDRGRIEVTETEIVRWLCYVGFFISAVLALVTLATNGRWIAFLIGVVIFGIPALKMYVLQVDAERQRATQATHAAMTARDAHGGGWDLGNDMTGDPTVPPQRPPGGVS